VQGSGTIFWIYNTLMIIQVEIVSFAFDPKRQVPFVVLRECCGHRTLRIGVNHYEAQMLVLQSLQGSRELASTIELAQMLIDSAAMKLERIVVFEQNQGAMGRLYLSDANRFKRVIVCRGADALCLALHYKAAIYADEQLLADEQQEQKQREKKTVQQRIRATDTLSMGHYFID